MTNTSQRSDQSHIEQTLGHLLRCARRKKGLTQIEVAEWISTSQSLISKFENDLRLPDVMVVITLAVLYDVTLDWLLSPLVQTIRQQVTE